MVVVVVVGDMSGCRGCPDEGNVEGGMCKGKREGGVGGRYVWV